MGICLNALSVRYLARVKQCHGQIDRGRVETGSEKVALQRGSLDDHECLKSFLSVLWKVKRILVDCTE